MVPIHVFTIASKRNEKFKITLIPTNASKITAILAIKILKKLNTLSKIIFKYVFSVAFFT